MTDQREIDPKLVEIYRQRRAPPGFTTRVAARAPRPARGWRPAWRSAAAVGVVAGAALVYVLAPAPTQPPAREMSVPPAPDYWAEISVPHDPPVSGLSDFGAVPLFPTRPDFDPDADESDHQSRAPRRRNTQLSHSMQQETIHEAI